jgi:hypothetical protein
MIRKAITNREITKLIKILFSTNVELFLYLPKKYNKLLLTEKEARLAIIPEYRINSLYFPYSAIDSILTKKTGVIKSMT